jgi:AcrR family transcriptional regulator
MADAHSSSGDPARSIALLWRDPAAVPRRGPARAWDLDAVVAAAIDLADDGGLAAVTIRAVARAVGAAPMSLYTYVPGKAELLDLMLDAAYAAMPRADTSGRGWRERVRAVAEENRGMFADHPWAPRVSTGRPPLGPGSIGKYEHELAAFDGLGLDDVDRDACLAYVVEFVRAAALAVHDAADARAGGQDDAQWWAEAGPVLERVLDPAAYPLASRVGAAAGTAHGSAADPDHAYRFGLDRVLDGLAAFVDRAQAGSTAERGPADPVVAERGPADPVVAERGPADPAVAERAPAGPAGRLDALDTEIRRGRRARGADPTADPVTSPHPRPGGTHDDTAPDDRTA